MEEKNVKVNNQIPSNNTEIEELFYRLNSSVLLTLLFEKMGEFVFDMKEIEHLLSYDMPPNDTSVNPYDPEFNDYIKDIGGHVNVYHDHVKDKIKFNIVSYEEGIRTQKEGNTVGFFSIRRPWNVYGIRPAPEREEE